MTQMSMGISYSRKDCKTLRDISYCLAWIIGEIFLQIKRNLLAKSYFPIRNAKNSVLCQSSKEKKPSALSSGTDSHLPSLAYSACIHNGLRRQCSGAPHKQRVRCSRQVSSSLYPSPGLSITCHRSAHQPGAYITRLSASLLMRLGSSPSIILVSLLHSGNILAQRNKETWAMMVHSQAFPPVHGHTLFRSTDSASPGMMSGNRVHRGKSKNLFRQCRLNTAILVNSPSWPLGILQLAMSRKVK